MYDLVYQFIYNQIFNSSELTAYHYTILGVDTNLNVWLSHTFTILFMCVLLICAWIFLRWLFKVISGLVLLK